MNILTFDIEEWFLYEKNNLYKNSLYVEKLNNLLYILLDNLEKYNIQATFFCIGIIAKKYPNVINTIISKGHEIACHSNKHEWLTTLSVKQFDEDTYTAIDSIEQLTGRKIICYRAPAFSITSNNLWTFEILAKYGIEIDCSIFPAKRDFGGLPEYNCSVPSLLIHNGILIKEFPVSITDFFGKKIIYSGGGYFRLMPYKLIKYFMKNNDYTMTYFHLRDFDVNQKKKYSLRYFKNYYGIEYAFKKFLSLINDYNFINIKLADELIDWNTVKKIII
jgi:polysaccharide deacetylase family protein (PEP-CTERM system associated)